MSPSGPSRSRRADRSACQRASDTMMAPSAGRAAPSSRTCQASVRARPSRSMSGIEALLERVEADPAVGVEEALASAAQAHVGGDNRFDRGDDAICGEGRADDVSERGRFVGAAAECHLVELLALLVDAENADMADMVMAAGIDTAGDLDLELADGLEPVELLERQRDPLSDRDRAGVGEAAI